MKIAFLLDTFPSLTETFIARDIEALRYHGLEIEIFALNAGQGAQSLISKKSLSLLLQNAWGKIADAQLRAAYFKAVGAAWWTQMQQSGAAREISHLHAGWASHPAYIAWGAAEKSGLTWSFSGHARDIFVEGGDLRGKIRDARFAAVCTKVALHHLENIAPDETYKFFYAPHGIETDKIPFATWNKPSVPKLLAVGRLVEKKGFGVFLDACAILQAQNFAFEARIIGDGPLRESLLTRRNRLNLQNNVQISGALPQREILVAMRQASCLVVPALVAADGDRDGLPNVILEAAATGLPIVATNTGAISEFVDERTGFLCVAGKAEALATTIQKSLENESETNARRVAARERVEASFNARQSILPLAEGLKICTVKR